jgi:hypothetical protein
MARSWSFPVVKSYVSSGVVFFPSLSLSFLMVTHLTNHEEEEERRVLATN